MNLSGVSDVEILDAIGAELYDGVGAQAAMEDLLAEYDVDDDDDDDDLSGDEDEILDALGAKRRRRRTRHRRKVIRMARKKLKSFRRQVAPSPIYTWTALDSNPRDLELQVIRPFKVQDMLVAIYDVDGFTQDPNVATMTSPTINGVQQNVAAATMALGPWGAIEGSQTRPRIDLDTVNTTVPLTATLAYQGATIGIAPAEVNIQIFFAGIAAVR